jgi:hypothetical protein
MKRTEYTTTSQKFLHFLAGFLGWFIVNGLLWLLLAVAGGTGSVAIQGLLLEAGVAPGLAADIFAAANLACSCLVLLLNLGTMIYFATNRYWIALGELAAFGTSLLLTLCAALLFGAACFAILASMSGGG